MKQLCKTASCVNSRKYWVCTVPIYGLLCFSTLPVGYDDRKVKVEKTENSIVCIFMIPRPNQSPQYQLSACWRTFYLNRKFRMKYVFFCGVVIGVLGACLLVYIDVRKCLLLSTVLAIMFTICTTVVLN